MGPVASHPTCALTNAGVEERRLFLIVIDDAICRQTSVR
jgi:hypothetical protein